MSKRQPGLILFAKSPRPGEVKTRLQPHCSAEQAAELAAMMMAETARLAQNAWPGPVELCVTPDTGGAIVQEISARFQLPLSQQCDGDLGRRMQHAMTHSGYPCAVMGCDVPHCPSEEIARAFELLTEGEDVIGPGTDGGYFLIGLQRPVPAIFDKLDWGREMVLSDTLQRGRESGVNFHRLSLLNDIDTYEDLSEAALGYPLFARWLEKNGLEPHVFGKAPLSGSS